MFTFEVRKFRNIFVSTMSDLQVVPWYNIEEWRDVYDKIYSQTASIKTKQSALEQLLMWKARCPSLPSGIESTLTLLEVDIQDSYKRNEICSDNVIRLAYSSALMRFVNHMLDTETAKGLSLYKAARSLGVPDWIIELRHDTAHSDKLPQLELLREACRISLEWLHTNYWEKHEQCIGDYVVGQVYKSEAENKLVALFNFCISLSICSHSKLNIKNVAEIPDARLRESLISDARELIGCGIDYSNLKTVSINGLINSINSIAKKLLDKNITSHYVNKVLLSEDSLFLSLELHNAMDNFNPNFKKRLSKQYVLCFEELLYLLHTYDLLQDFILELIKVTRDELGEQKCKLAASWVSSIANSLRKNQQFLEKIHKNKMKDVLYKDKKELKSLYYHWFPNEKSSPIIFNLHKSIPEDLVDINFIQPIISTYNIYHTYYMGDLLHLIRPQLPQPVIDKICNLSKVIASPEKFPVISSKIYTIDDLKIEEHWENLNKESSGDSFIHQSEKHENDIEFVSQEYEQQKYGIFQTADRNQAWSICPIGRLPWQILSIDSNK